MSSFHLPSSSSISSSGDHLQVLRWLEDLGSNETNATSSAPTATPLCDEDLAGSTDARDLRNTMRLYGSIFMVIMIIFCCVRRKYPKVYNVRNHVEDLKTELAEDARGSIAWLWRLFGITDAEMMQECGMDALCYARVLEFGMRLAMVGVLNSLWLIPIYATATTTDDTACITDWVVSISIAHVPVGSYRYIAAVLGAYSIFGYTMYAILQEFIWFARYRHLFLSKPLARNYAVYVQCIPSEYQTNEKLLEFFQQSSSAGAVLDAHLALKVPGLAKKVAQREALVSKLEHTINIEEIKGTVPTTPSVPGMGGGGIPLSQDLTRKLHDINQEIAKSLDEMEQRRSSRNGASGRSTATGMPPIAEDSDILVPPEMSTSVHIPSQSLLAADYGGTDDRSKISAISLDNVSEMEDEGGSTRSNSNKPGSKAASFLTSGLKNSLATAADAANRAKSLLEGAEDGKPHSAGFVTFKTLRAAQAAKQMLQYAEPFAMEVLEAPQPEDIFWKNVGKTHHELQVGKLLSFGLTVALCLFWTIPMSFISSLSNIEGLRTIGFIDDLLDALPFLEPLFAQLAPLLIIVAQSMLKVILELLSGLEGPVSGAVISSKLFSKLSAFMIIQTFFVSTIGGSIMPELEKLVNDPTSIIEVLSRELPGQSTFFIQILIVDTAINMGIELLRVVPLAMALIRRFVGPRLTEKERETTWMGIRPLSDPQEFEHADVLSGTVLYYIVFFVYATLAPITAWFMLICFSLLAAGYRHQFVYIYPTFPDSGGKLWAAFFKLLPSLMLIAQFTMVGILALSKSAVASAMMIPLVVVTVLFTVYINQKHFALTEFLPAKDALAVDLRNNIGGEMNLEFLKDKYIQPELQDREVWPENLNVEREIEHGCLSFDTPPASENGDDDREAMTLDLDGSIKKRSMV